MRLASAPAFGSNAPGASQRVTCAIWFAHLRRSFRFAGARATSAYRLEALGALRATVWLRGSESEAHDARVSRALLGRGRTRGAEGHVCGHVGVHDPVIVT